MCDDEVRPDGSAAVTSGGDRSTRYRTHARLEFIRYHYVVYPDLGSNLEDGFFGFLQRVLQPASARDFFYIEPGEQHNLRVLFQANSMAGVPDRFENYYDFPNQRWIYILRDVGDVEMIELDYRDATNWGATTYHWEGDELVPVSAQESGEGERFTLNRRNLENCYAIALPEQINPESAANILATTDQPSLDLFRLIQVDPPAGNRQVDLRIVVFDPTHIIERTVEVMNAYNRLMRLVDARVRHGRLRPADRNLRRRGLLACICKKLVDGEGSLQNEVSRPALNRAFNRYANYGVKKARFIDNIYNFITHPIMRRIEEKLMEYLDDDVPVDGAAWLKIILPLAAVAGQHALLAEYFHQASQNTRAESAWATYFAGTLNRGTARDNTATTRFNTALGNATDIVKMMTGVAETRVYNLVSEYSAGRIEWQEFNRLLSEDGETLNRFPPYIRGAGNTTQRLRAVRGVMVWGGRLGRLAAVCQGDVSGSFTAALDTISDAADNHSMKALAARVSLVKNAYDIWTHAAGFVGRLDVEDYDAAFGRGLCLAASVTELGYIVLTGSTIGGPVGAVVAIVGAAGALIVLVGTDSERERFMRHCIWGRQARGSTDAEGWCTAPFNRWHDTDEGVEIQLNSLMNLLHKFEVDFSFSRFNMVVGIEIITKYLPDRVKYVFYGQFEMSDGSMKNARVEFDFPSRNSRHARRLYPRQESPRPLRGANVYVSNGRSDYTIHLNLLLSREGIRGAKGWIVCYPFGHNEFVVPTDNRGVYLPNLFDPPLLNIGFETDNFNRLPV